MQYYWFEFLVLVYQFWGRITEKANSPVPFAVVHLTCNIYTCIQLLDFHDELNSSPNLVLPCFVVLSEVFVKHRVRMCCINCFTLLAMNECQIC